MNKNVLLAFSVALFTTTAAFSAPRKIAYEQRENIFVADLDGAHAKKIAAGALPDISPDGTRVAFNTEDDAKSRGPERHIAIADVATGSEARAHPKS